jgi:hypothetical protein
MQVGDVEKNRTKMRVGFRIRTPSVPRAPIIWLAHAVKVVRPVTRRLHLDRVRSAKGWHLGITLGVCMSGFRYFTKITRPLLMQHQTISGTMRDKFLNPTT